MSMVLRDCVEDCHMRKKDLRHLLLPVAALGLGLGLSGCGGDSGSASGTTTITGSAIAGAVSGNLAVHNAQGATLATAAVTNGAFSVALPDAALSGELDFVVTGSYSDEVSGGSVTLGAAQPLALRIAANHFQSGQAGNAPITPDSSIIRALVADHRMTLAAAQTAFENVFGYQPDMDAVPFDPAATGSSAAAGRAQGDKDAAFRVGMFSQLASDFGLTGDAIAALPGALASDLGDGDLDGVGSTGNPVIIGAINLQSLHRDSGLPFRLLKAHAGFVGQDEANHAGLSAPAMGLPAVVYDASGTEKTITTAKGRHLKVTLDTVADAPFNPGFSSARVRHRLTVIDADTSQPIDITTDPDIIGFSNHPMMHMLSGHHHTTPHAHAPDVSGKAAGQYVLDNYYVMASATANGTPLGVWDYVFKINEDADGNRATTEATTDVTFHPKVEMTMGSDLLSVSASNSSDRWTSMTGTAQPRPYRTWLHEVKSNAGGGHDLTLFITTQNIANPAAGADPHAHTLSFPSVIATRTLQGPVDATTGVRPDVTINSVTVEVSIDGGTTWQALTADGTTGRYAITALAGLSNTLQVRLTVNGKVMMTAAGALPELKFMAP